LNYSAVFSSSAAAAFASAATSIGPQKVHKLLIALSNLSKNLKTLQFVKSVLQNKKPKQKKWQQPLQLNWQRKQKPRQKKTVVNVFNFRNNGFRLLSTIDNF
jgi:hypothetical protein